MAFLPVIDELKNWRTKLEEILAVVTEQLAGGIAEDFPQYRYYSGYIALLREQIVALDERILQLEKTDNDEQYT